MLYLAYLDGHDLPARVDGPWRETFRLRPGLVSIDSEQRRSVVYHALKEHVPPGTALLVMTATEVPKCRGMDPGAVAWMRERAPHRSNGA